MAASVSTFLIDSDHAPLLPGSPQTISTSNQWGLNLISSSNYDNPYEDHNIQETNLLLPHHQNQNQNQNQFQSQSQQFNASINHPSSGSNNAFATPKNSITTEQIITVMGPQPSRSGSIVSRLATLRSRNKILNRNKMVRRKDYEMATSSGYKPQNDRIDNTHSNMKGSSHLQHSSNDKSYRTTSGLEWNDPDVYGRTINAYANVDNSKSFESTKQRFLHHYFTFPVKRRTSLKRKSTRPPKVSNPNFRNAQEIDNFMNASLKGANISLAELLPKFVDFFEFNQIFLRNPKLKTKVLDVGSSGIGRLDMFPTKRKVSQKDVKSKIEIPTKMKKTQQQNFKNKKVQISAPIKETFTKNGYNPYIGDVRDPTKLGAAAGALANAHDLLGTTVDVDPTNDTLDIQTGQIMAFPTNSVVENATTTPYSHYRETAFAAKNMKPAPYTDFFPGSTIPKKKIAQMDRTLYLDVLLRRTVAAKIKYRLSNNVDHRLPTHELESYSSSNSDGSEPNHLHDLPKLSKSESSEESDTESIDTTDLIKKSGSLLSSDLLPSPQISYLTDIFAKIEGFDIPDLGLDKSRISLPLLLPGSGLELNTTSGSIPLLQGFSSANPDNYQPYQYVNKKSTLYRGLYDEEMDLITPQRETFELKPRNRSRETLSTSDGLSSQDHNEHTQSTNSTSVRTSRTTPSKVSRTNSDSGNTKIIHTQLDKIVHEITSFMESELKHSPSFSRPKVFQSYSPQTPPRAMFHTLKSSSSVQVLNTSSVMQTVIPEQPLDIKSLQGSIHVAKSDVTTTHSSFHNYGVNPQWDSRPSFLIPKKMSLSSKASHSSARYTYGSGTRQAAKSMSSSVYSGTETTSS